MSSAIAERGAGQESAGAAAGETVFAIVGNPNCGKSTIFNALTGLKQKVANYPGVTVEKKEGFCFSQHGKRFRLLDLPGAYSLNARSPDEAVVRDVLLGRRSDTPLPDAVVFVADASNLERNLYLATQVFELGLPSLLVLNMMDVAEEKHWRLDLEKLSHRLGVPVVPMQATAGKGIIELKAAMSRKLDALPHRPPPIPSEIGEALEQTRAELVAAGMVKEGCSLLEPLYLVSDHDPDHYGIRSGDLGRLADSRKALEKRFQGWEESLASARYEEIEKILHETLRRPERDEATFTDRLDAILLHPLWGGVCFAAVMLLVFYMIFRVAEGPMDWIDKMSGIFGNWIESKMAAGDVRDLLVNGVITGVSGVVKFLPQILILFFFIGFMEDTGYMARVAFIMDRFMGRVGLNGRSFVPFFSSYACAVPGIMATRTIASTKDRLITILIAPLASCSARLPVYSLMIAAMFPANGVSSVHKALIMMSMYALGTTGAFLFAWLFNRTLVKGQGSLMVLEMPSYKWPSFKHLCLFMLERAKLFLSRAGTVILGLSILLWAAKTYPKGDGAGEMRAIAERLEANSKLPESEGSPEYREAQLQKLKDMKASQLAGSVAGRAGHLIEPLIKPLGFDWKIGIGLISSFAAREFFVGTMGIIYAVDEDGDDVEPLREKLATDKWPDGRPIFTPLVCISLMVFYVFAMQCLSTVAVVKRETNGWKWPLFQLGYMTATAYLASLIVYQGGRLFGF
jgi:ferrous iron transport protein B